MGDKYKNLFINRVGLLPTSYMITNNLILIFPVNSIITLNNNEIKLSDKYNIITKIPKQVYSNIPPYCIVYGRFLNSIHTLNKSNNNILGNNSIFITNIKNIKIPIMNNIDEYLYFYGCKCLYNNDIIKLNNIVEMPFFNMSIGPDYKTDYLLIKELGGGFYIEKHNTPHLHQPLNKDACGYIVLAKKIDNRFILSKFKIPYMSALYISPNTYHNDSLLLGEYNVAYTKTDDYITYLFRTGDDNIVDVS